MAEYRTVRMAFWHDPYIEELPAQAKLLYLYMFTCTYTSNLGVLEATRRKIAYETGISLPEVDKYINMFASHGKLVADEKMNLIFLCNFIKHQTSTSPKLLEGLQRIAPLVSSPIIAQAICIRYPQVYGLNKHDFDTFDTLHIPYANGMHSLCIASQEIGNWKLEEGSWKLEEGNDAAPNGAPTDVGATSVGATSVGATSVGATSVAVGDLIDVINLSAGNANVGHVANGGNGANDSNEAALEKKAKTFRPASSTLGKLGKFGKLEKLAKAEKKAYGDNAFVLLTADEHIKLCEKFTPDLTTKAINFLDLHIGSKGKDPYKSHYLALQKWVFDAVREREARYGQPPINQIDWGTNLEPNAETNSGLNSGPSSQANSGLTGNGQNLEVQNNIPVAAVAPYSSRFSGGYSFGTYQSPAQKRLDANLAAAEEARKILFGNKDG